MQPTLVREPFHRNGWVYEEKVDGWRILAHKDGDRVRLVSRNGRDHTRRFADLAAAVAKLSARTLVLDGEVAIYDQQLRSRFDWLREPDPDAVASPPLYMAFDLLYQDRRDLTTRPLRDRRARLEDVVTGSDLVFPVRRLAANGLDAWAQVVERGYEGYVAKDEASVYEAGRRGGGSRSSRRTGPSPRTAGNDGSSGRTGDDVVACSTSVAHGGASVYVGENGVPECAWLMWAYALDQQAGEHYSIEAARPTNPDCLAALKTMAVVVKKPWPSGIWW
jgi:ATP dependent DNA ligase domain